MFDIDIHHAIMIERIERRLVMEYMEYMRRLRDRVEPFVIGCIFALVLFIGTLQAFGFEHFQDFLNYVAETSYGT